MEDQTRVPRPGANPKGFCRFSAMLPPTMLGPNPYCHLGTDRVSLELESNLETTRPPAPELAADLVNPSTLNQVQGCLYLGGDKGSVPKSSVEVRAS